MRKNPKAEAFLPTQVWFKMNNDQFQCLLFAVLTYMVTIYFSCIFNAQLIFSTYVIFIISSLSEFNSIRLYRAFQWF